MEDRKYSYCWFLFISLAVSSSLMLKCVKFYRSGRNWLLIVYLHFLYECCYQIIVIFVFYWWVVSCLSICSNILLHMTMLLPMKAGTWRSWHIQGKSLHDKTHSPVRTISIIEVWYDSLSLTLGWKFIQVEPHIKHHCLLLSFFAVTFSTIILGVLHKLTLIYKLVYGCNILWLIRLLPPLTLFFSKKHSALHNLVAVYKVQY